MRLLLGISIIVLLGYTSMFADVTVPNERTRVYLTAALVDDHALTIDGPVSRFGKTTDIAKASGHYYTDKAPGSSLAGAILYGAARIFTPKDAWSPASIIRLMRLGLMVPVSLLGCVLLMRLLHRLGIGRTAADITVVAWILGTAAFHYGTAFYGHQLVAVSLLGALLLFFGSPDCSSDSRAAALGAVLGFAGLTEYQALIPCTLIAGFAAVGMRRSPRRIVALCLGALPFAAAFLAYHKIAFGGFFALPYEHLASKSIQALHSKGVAGVFLPRPAAVYGALLSLHRGLLATSPIFAAVPFGLYLWARKQPPHRALLVGLLFAYYLWFIFSAQVWFAGWSFGPRLLVPTMGVALIPAAFVLDALPFHTYLSALCRGGIAFGILYHQTVQLVFAELPPSAKNPLWDLIVPALKAGVLSPNRAAELTGRPGLWTAAIPAAAVAAVLVFLAVGYGQKLRPALRARNLAAWAVSIAIPIAVLFASDPAWSRRETRKFVRWMTVLEEKEFPREPE